MNKLKKLLVVVFLFSILVVVFLFRNEISHFVMEKFIIKKEIVTYGANEYEKKDSFRYAQETDQFFPKNKQELKNIMYTFLNKGWERFVFYCKDTYEDCQKDLHTITEEEAILADLNNYVHPFNSYQNLHVTINDYGKITLSVDSLYTQEEIKIINQKLEEIKSAVLRPDMSVRDQIKAFHDYIVEHTTYDSIEAGKIENQILNANIKSHKATNVLFNGLGLCGGYSDAMAIFLSSMNLPNYKIANDKHVWNFVKLDDTWYHIDLTWDDPVTSDHQNILIHDFFLITTKELDDFHTAQHAFDRNVYLEAN